MFSNDFDIIPFPLSLPAYLKNISHSYRLFFQWNVFPCLGLSPFFGQCSRPRNKKVFRIPKNPPSRVNRSGGGKSIFNSAFNHIPPQVAVFISIVWATDRTFLFLTFLLFSFILLPFLSLSLRWTRDFLYTCTTSMKKR